MTDEMIMNADIIYGAGKAEPARLYVRFIYCDGDPCFTDTDMSLRSRSFNIRSGGLRYSDSLKNLLTQMPKGSALRFYNNVEIETDSASEIIVIEEILTVETVTRKKPEIKREYLDEKYADLPLDAQYFLSLANEGYSEGKMPESKYRQHTKWVLDNIENNKRTELESYKPAEQLVFTLKCDYNNKHYEVQGRGDFYDALFNLSKQIDKAQFNICAKCRLSDHRSYGDEDLRHGLFCFRDLDVDMNVVWYQREEMFAKAIRNVSAFHWCDKFKCSDAYWG